MTGENQKAKKLGKPLVSLTDFWHNRNMKLTVQRLTRIALLAALCIALRYVFYALPNVQPITAIFFVATLTLGLIDGFLVMAITMVLTGILFGFGPWVFNQILTYSVLLAFWSLIGHHLSLVWQILLTTILSFLYGVIMDYSYGLIYNSGLIYVINGLSFDGLHAISTFFFYPIIMSIFRRFNK